MELHRLLVIVLIAMTCVTYVAVAQTPLETYLQQRQHLIDQENNQKAGAEIQLTPTEERANSKFKELQQRELQHYKQVPPWARSFFLRKFQIDRSPHVLSLLSTLPKGSVLHIHLGAATTYDWIVQNITYSQYCYVFVDDQTLQRLDNLFEMDSLDELFAPITSINEIEEDQPQPGEYHFFKGTPPPAKHGQWMSMNALRAMSDNITKFDTSLENSFTMKYKDYGTYVQLWDKFDSIFMRMNSLLAYRPAWEGWWMQVFTDMISDNVQHLEVREPSSDRLYDLDGNTFEPFIITRQILQRVQQTYPFFTFKWISAFPRKATNQDMMKFIQQAETANQQYPDMVVGFDLMGPEDSGFSLVHFAPMLLNTSLSFFFHSGETVLPSTNQFSVVENHNLYDAVLLNTSRIGHGLQLSQHPELIRLVKQQNICVEVNPISNQLLHYLQDMRNHPALVLLNQNVTIAISPDDPGVYGYRGVTYDWYEAVMAWQIDLKVIKRLALNSLNHSVWSNNTQKQTALSHWTNEWNQWILNLANQDN